MLEGASFPFVFPFDWKKSDKKYHKTKRDLLEFAFPNLSEGSAVVMDSFYSPLDSI
jgi:hypothetical protein